tara:strand:- start:1831 stop:3843 length:2013 start_codon:yes stop_codon:yes gene_type:complete
MNNSDFHILNLAAYQTPEITEDPREDFIAYGDDNDFYKEIIDAFLNSPTTSSIITGIANQISGKGLAAHDASRKPDQYAQFKSLFKSECIKRVSTDLKLLGEAAFQITYKGKKISSVSHFNRETLRAEKCDAKGVINAYYYHPNWPEYSHPEELTRIPVFGSGSTNEIYIIRKFIPSMHYYSPPSWVSALNYSKLECEISQYLVNEVNNSFSGTKLVSFVNGLPTVEKQQMIASEIKNKLTGANGEKVIVSFSDSADSKTMIEDITVSDAADIYSYIAEECSRKLMLANSVTSPLLVGIRDGNSGLGSNAEEISNAQNLFENITIKPFQELILDAVNNILAHNGIALDLYFKTLTPIEFTDTTDVLTKDQIEEETGEEIQDAQVSEEVVEKTTPTAEVDEDNKASYNGAQIASALSILQNVKEGIITTDQAIVFLVQMLQFDINVAKSMFDGTGTQKLFSKMEKEEDLSEDNSFDDQEMFKLISEFGEDEDEQKWELVDSRNVDYEQEEAFDKMIGLAYAGQALPNTKSKQDKKINGVDFKVRYKYDGKISDNTRKFCELMINANKLYRKEDIIKMGTKQVNPGWGPKGADTYSIWLFKGGGSCSHKWVRQTFKGKTEGNLKNLAPNISTGKSRKEGFNPVNEKEVSMKPRDIGGNKRGFLKPKNWKTSK